MSATALFAAFVAALGLAPREAAGLVLVPVHPALATIISPVDGGQGRRLARDEMRAAPRAPVTRYRTRLLVLLAILVLLIWLIFRAFTGWNSLVL
jgi:hypothetical protein